MRKTILLTIVTLTVCIQSWGDSFTVDDFKYVTNSDGSVSIARADGVTLAGELIIPSSVTYNGKEYVVSKVASCGFCDTDITKAVLPKSITAISEESFSDCTSLKTVILPTYLTSIGRRAFYGCDLLESVECRMFFPVSMSVNAKAFSESQFANINLYVPTGSLSAYKSHEIWQKFVVMQEKDMEDVDNTMFTFTVTGDNTVSVAAYDTNRLAGDIVIPGEVVIDGKTYTVTSVAFRGFNNCRKITSVTLPNTIVNMDNYAFSSCSGLTSVTIPNSVMKINACVFQGCSSLENIILPEMLTEIGTWAFSNTAIAHIVLPESLKTIDSWAFSNCLKLEKITIPKNVKNIYSGVFSGCDALKNITVEEGNAYFLSKDGMLISKDGKTMYAYAFAYPTEHLVIPETVVSLRSYLFSGNDILKSISVPSGVTSIGESTFQSCSALTNVRLPDGVTSLGYYAFNYCTSLKTIIIPQSLNNYNGSPYQGCKAVDSVVVRQNMPLEISTVFFDETVYKNATLYVPIGRTKYYKDLEGWAKFANIKEIEMEGVETSDSPFDNIEENQMILGYYTSNDMSSSDNGYGGRNAGRYKVCVRYTKEQIASFAGNHITNIRFALVNTNILGAKLWIGSTRDKKDLYEQSVTTLKEGWNEVALRTPFAITGDTIFIGLEYKQSGSNFPLSAVSTGYQEGSAYFYGPYNGSDEDEVWLESADRSLSIQCIVEGDHIPLYDLHTVRMSISGKYMKAGEQYNGYIYLRNWGKKSVNSAKIACEIDGHEVSERKISNIDRNVNSYNVSFKVDNNLPAGQHAVTLRVKEINDEVPTFAADDTQSKNVKFYTEDMGRDKVLVELCTGTWCGYCPRAHKSIEQMMEGRDDIVLVSNHYSDKLSCEASEEYCVFTNSFPATFYDRYAPYGATSLGGISVDNAKMQPSLAKLSIQAEYDEGNRTVSVIVKGEKNDEFDLVEEYANLTLLLTEDGVVSPQADNYEGTVHNDYIHNGVLRTNVSAIWGDPVTWNGDKFEMHYTIKLDDKWVKDNMHIVAFLAKPFTNNNYEEIGLVNCNDFALRNAIITSVISSTDLSSADIYVMGRSIFVKGKYRSMQVYSISGSVVENNNLPVGTYIVKVYTDSGIIIKKIVIR